MFQFLCKWCSILFYTLCQKYQFWPKYSNDFKYQISSFFFNPKISTSTEYIEYTYNVGPTLFKAYLERYKNAQLATVCKKVQSSDKHVQFRILFYAWLLLKIRWPRTTKFCRHGLILILISFFKVSKYQFITGIFKVSIVALEQILNAPHQRNMALLERRQLNGTATIFKIQWPRYFGYTVKNPFVFRPKF